MIKKLYILFFFTLVYPLSAQNCVETTDSLYSPSSRQTSMVSVLNCPLKNGGNIQFFNNNGKYVLKLTLREKFGFVNVGSLQIRSGSKGFFVRNATLYNHKSPEAYFLVDVMINYIGTLKEDGITSVVFMDKFEAKLSKEDMKNVRATARCFYEANKK